MNPCDTTQLPNISQRIVHELTTYPETPLPHLAFKNALQKPFGELAAFQGMSHPSPCMALQ